MRAHRRTLSAAARPTAQEALRHAFLAPLFPFAVLDLPAPPPPPPTARPLVTPAEPAEPPPRRRRAIADASAL
jgi:hypothetical protein